MNMSKSEEVLKRMKKACANLEEYLMPAPISIAILGELACIAAERGDFAINLAPPKGGYKYIRHPDSFHASLMQVSNSGWHAFSIAHKNMDGIRLLSMSVPEQIKMVTKTLFQDDLVLTDVLVPGQLSSLKSIANECSSLSKAVENKFNDVICLIGELLEECLNSKSQYKQRLVETQHALEDFKLRKQAAEDALVKADEYYREIKNRVTQTFDDYRNAVDSIPTGWNARILEFTSSIQETLMLPISNPFLSSKKDKWPIPFHSRSEEGCDSEDDFIAMTNICALSTQILTLVNALQIMVDKEGNIDMDILYNRKHNEIKAVWTEKKSRQLLEKIRKERKCHLTDLAMNICNYIIDISKILTEAVESGAVNKKKLLKKMNALSGDIIIFDSRTKSCNRTSPFGPMEILKMSQEEYQKSFEKLEQQNKDLLDLLSKTKKIDFEKAEEMLIKGLDAMGRVKQQWEKMVCFFQMLSNLIDSCLNKPLTDFVKSAEGLRKIPNYSHKDFVIDMIYKQAFNISNISHLVHMISETYAEVSSKYLMDELGSLSRLISMDPSNPQFQIEYLKLANACDSAQEAIQDLVIKQKKEYENNTKASGKN